MGLTEHLIETGALKTEIIISAFKKVKRIDFLPEKMKSFSEEDESLFIGSGQTNSQPSVVAFMMEQLSPKPGEKILDVGSGSGWTSVLLSEIVGPKGKVVSLELLPELKETGERNAYKYGFISKGTEEFVLADGSKGYEKQAPYDKILASASARSIPVPWKEQLKIGGRIVAPVRFSIVVCDKLSETEFREKEYPGFMFVPLVSK